MGWKDLKISTKIYGILGIVTMFLIFFSVFVFFGVNNIKLRSDDLVLKEQLHALIMERKADHFFWMERLNQDIHAGKKTNSVEVDEKKCKFADMLYGQGKTDLIGEFPQLENYLNEVEEPHKRLHQSANEIYNLIKPYDLNFDIGLRNANISKLNWMAVIQDAILLKKTSTEVIANADECEFGKWLNSHKTKESIKKLPEIARHESDLDKYHRQMHKSLEKINNALVAKQFDRAAQIYASELKQQHKEFTDVYNKMFAISKESIEGYEKALAIYYNTTLPMANEVIDIFSEIEVHIEKSQSGDNSVNALVVKLEQKVSLISIVTVILALLMGYFFTSNIVSRISLGINFAQQIGKGDLTAEIENNVNDELGELADALINFRNQLRLIVSGINSGAESIGEASHHLSSTSQELSQASSEQASTAEEVSSSMEQMTANIQQNADNSSQTHHITQASLGSLKSGSEKIFGVINAMQKIAEKISIVNDIAFQTNILALNASVEAARAGEHGRGFSVVAEEVRSLAQSSKEAAKEIRMVVQSGLKLADESNALLNEILPQMEKTAILVKEISLASSEQNGGVGQINDSLQALNQVVQQNAASAEEMASNSEELSAQAQQLKDMMKFFKLDEKITKMINTTQKAKIAKPKYMEIKHQKPIVKKTSAIEINLNKDNLDNEFEKF